MRTRTLVILGAATALTCTAITVAPAATNYPKGYETWKCGNTSNRMVLTFDDAPGDHGSPYTQSDMLYWGAYLKGKGIRAMFFVSGRPWVTTELRAQGHYVGNHGSTRHPKFSQLTPSQVKAEVLASVPGNLVRPPHGDYDAENKTTLANMGMRVCTWHAKLSTHDWDKGSGPRGLRSTDSIREIIRNGAPNAGGGVILGHLWTNFPQALPGIINDMHAQGRLFCKNSGPVTETVPFPLKCT